MPVVYDGVGGDRGDLFQGLKLWISHRVPMRSRWLDLVKGNGGEVVPLEKQADMLIADNVKRGGAPPPDGAYTWKWIEYSVKNHFLQPKDDYLITSAAPRAIGSSAPAKATRTPFTNHDDLVLTKFVLAKETMGEKTTGQEIYKELERKHPHHTWQSWRERWVKNLSFRSRRNLPVEDVQPEVDVGASPGIAARSPESVEPVEPATASEPKRRTRNAQHSGASVSAASPRMQAKTRGRNFFTKEEDELLLNYIREAQEHNLTAIGNRVMSLSGNKIYQQFAEEYPSHTWHSWRDRWLRHLSRVDDIEEDELDPQEEEEQAADHIVEEPQLHPQQRVKEHTAKPRGVAAAEKTIGSNRHAEVSAANSTAIPPSKASSTAKRAKAKSDDERLERQEQAKRKDRATKLLQRTWRGFTVRRDTARFETLVVPLQSLVRGYLVRMREAERLLQESEAGDQLPQDVPDEQDTEQYTYAEKELGDIALGPEDQEADGPSARDQFFADLQDYIDVSGAEIDREPVVDGRKIDLWDLFRTTTQQDGSPQERNWKEVAEELGFDWVKSARCLPKLWDCWIQNLANFEEAINSYDNAASEGEEEDEEEDEDEEGPQQPKGEDRDDNDSEPRTSEAVTAPKEPSASPSSHAYRSSPPTAGVKRSFQQADSPSPELGYPSDSSRKRRRLEQKTEIPPTPEDRLGLKQSLAGRRWANDNSSPLKPGKSDGVHSFEGEFERGADELLDGIIEDVEGADELPEHPRPPKQKFVEPETQDFGFALGGDHGYTTEEDDISPSQQLRTESDMINSPVLHSPSEQNAASTPKPRHFAATRPRPAVDTVTKPASSEPRTTVINATRASTQLGGSTNGKPTKRSLPPAYQKPSSTAPGRTSGFAPIRNNIAQPPRSGPNPSVPVRAFAVPPPRSWTGPTSRPNFGNHPTPRMGMLSSPTPLRPSSRRAPSSSAPPLPLGPRNVPKSAKPSNAAEDPAVIDAQFAHFEALGYEKAHIGRAMEAATFQRGPMTVALQSLHEGRGLPQKEAGVWTDDEDNKLRAVMDYDRRRERGKYAAGLEDDPLQRARIEVYRTKLTAKHGRWMESRMRFMDMIDDV